MSGHDSNQDALLACYASLRSTAERMLEAARNADWPAVAQAENACDEIAEAAREFGDPLRVLDEQGRRERREMLHSVLRADSRIRDLRDPWLSQIGRYVGRGAARSNTRD